MIDVEVLGAELAPDAPPLSEVRRLCMLATAVMGVHHGHLAIEFVDAERIARLNLEHRDEPRPTDVLSFPIDGLDPIEPAREIESEQSTAGASPERELGDVIICPEYTVEVREAIVHGVLHLLGMDHETDDGEMLALQLELLTRASA
ncbi:MAG: rRNA maturation RNase YbeY [Solirubrobacteraceae bacterium]|jgi:probable rRNA maturation factor